MANNSLIPTSRTDKNGRTVIRHMKPQDAGTASKKLPIAPLSVANTQEQLLSETTGTLAKLAGTIYPDKDGIEHVRETAAKCFHWFSPKTLSRINDYPWKPRDVGNFVYKVESEGWGEDEPKVNDFLAAFETLSSVRTAPEWLLRGLDRYEGVCPQDDNGDYPDERKDQINALFAVTGHLINTGGDIGKSVSYDDTPIEYLIGDEKLSAFIINPGENYTRDEIVKVITERNVTEVDDIKELLSTNEAALRSGVL